MPTDDGLSGCKSGGPPQGISGLTDALGEKFGCDIIASDWDAAEKKPFAGAQRNRWKRLGKADVLDIG